jgi:hypothetical protein
LKIRLGRHSDFQWIDFYFWRYFGKNPFGHSGRRIADFYAGLMGDFRSTQKWKRLRRTLGGQLKTGNLWTGQTRQFPRAGRDQQVLLPSFVGAQIRLHFRPPAPRSALQHAQLRQIP